MEKREMKFITACPDDTYYTWQVHLWMESLKKLNKSEDAVVLIFTPFKRKTNKSKWEKIISLYPEAIFKFYEDDRDEVTRTLIPIYIPIIRPWLMTQWFIENPNYKNHAIFYCDSDILFTEKFNVNNFVDDNINYLSNTNSYISVIYFDNKYRDVIPEKQEEYKKLDILSMLGSLIGITREQAEYFKDHSGGAQYLMKNLDSEFWKKVQTDCIIIRNYLRKINKEFFISEAKGFQSWCADMWAVLWNLWAREQETKVIDEMEFAWSTDSLNKLEKAPILHNAGVTASTMNGHPYFYKGKYHTGLDPTTDIHLTKVLEDKHTQTKCNWYYANELMNLKNKYKLNY